MFREPALEADKKKSNRLAKEKQEVLINLKIRQLKVEKGTLHNSGHIQCLPEHKIDASFLRALRIKNSYQLQWE